MPSRYNLSRADIQGLVRQMDDALQVLDAHFRDDAVPRHMSIEAVDSLWRVMDTLRTLSEGSNGRVRMTAGQLKRIIAEELEDTGFDQDEYDSAGEKLDAAWKNYGRAYKSGKNVEAAEKELDDAMEMMKPHSRARERHYAAERAKAPKGRGFTPSDPETIAVYGYDPNDPKNRWRSGLGT